MLEVKCGAAGQSWQHGEVPEVSWEEELPMSPQTGTEKKKKDNHVCLLLFLLFPSLSDYGKHASFTLC